MDTIVFIMSLEGKCIRLLSEATGKQNTVDSKRHSILYYRFCSINEWLDGSEINQRSCLNSSRDVALEDSNSN